MDKQAARRLEARVLELLAPLEKEGFKARPKGGTFGASSLTLRLELDEIGADGKVQTKEADDFKTYARRFGLSPAMLGGKFKINNGPQASTWTVVGLKPNSPTWPVLATNQNGRTVKVRPFQVRQGWIGEFPADMPALSPSERIGDMREARANLGDWRD